MKEKTPPITRTNYKTWVRYRKPLCKGCHSLCCTLPVEVSVADLQRMELVSAEETAFSIRKIGRKLKKQGYIESFRVELGLFTLRRHRNHDCIFLDENRLCKIYRKRPQVCRKFPELGPRPGYCPAKRKLNTQAD
jgi:Fe-S-cluster containining protein